MKKNLPSTPNFETKHHDNGSVTLIGFDEQDFEKFKKQCADAAIDSKHYRIAMIEADASPAQHGFMFAVYESVIEYLKWEKNITNRARIRLFFEDAFLNLAKSPDNDLYDYDYWVVGMVNLETGELMSEKLLPASSWTVGHKSQYIAFLESIACATWSDYKFPNPKEYKGTPIGEKSSIGSATKFFELAKK